MVLEFHNVDAGNCAAVTRNEVLRTSSPIAMPDGGVMLL